MLRNALDGGALATAGAIWYPGQLHLCNYHPGAHSALKIYRDRLFLLDLLQPQCIFYKIFRQKAIKMEDKEQPMILQITSMYIWFIYWSSATIQLNARDFCLLKAVIIIWFDAKVLLTDYIFEFWILIKQKQKESFFVLPYSKYIYLKVISR